MRIKPLSKYLFLYQTSENLPKEKIKKIDCLLIFLSILASGGFIYLSGLLYSGVTIITFLLVSALIIKKNKVNKSALKSFFIVLLFVLFIFSIKYIFQSEFQSITTYFFRFINIVIASLILIYFRNNTDYLNKIIYIVLFFIMLHSLLSFFVWHVVKNNLTMLQSVNKKTFYYIFYYWYSDSEVINDMNTVKFFIIQFLRTSGIFWEPGILQIYMNILLFISLFIYTNKKIAILSTIVILSTWSSTGLVILFIQLFFYTIQKIKGRNIWKTLIPLALFSLMTIPLHDNLINKYEGEAATAGSGYARALNTYTAINIIKKKPLFGMDLDMNVYKEELLKNKAFIDMPGYWEEREASNTNSILNYFVFFGIPLGMLILFSLYSQTIFSKNKFVFFLIIFTAMLTEPIGFFIFPLMLIFSNYILKRPYRSLS